MFLIPGYQNFIAQGKFFFLSCSCTWMEMEKIGYIKWRYTAIYMAKYIINALYIYLYDDDNHWQNV